MSGNEEREPETRVIEITYCLSCPYYIEDDWTESSYCLLNDRVIEGTEVENEIMDGCKLPLKENV